MLVKARVKQRKRPPLLVFWPTNRQPLPLLWPNFLTEINALAVNADFEKCVQSEENKRELCAVLPPCGLCIPLRQDRLNGIAPVG